VEVFQGLLAKDADRKSLLLRTSFAEAADVKDIDRNHLAE